MKTTNTFEELSKSKHHSKSFDCGEKELNDFLKTKALNHMNVGVSKTMVLPDKRPLLNKKYPICAFYSIAPSTIRRSNLPKKYAKKLPNYPIPVFLIAQLAVGKAFHNQGLGKVTLIKALEYLWDINAKLRANAIIVDCLNEPVQHFYGKYGFQILCEHNGRIRMFLPMDTVEKLFTQ